MQDICHGFADANQVARAHQKFHAIDGGLEHDDKHGSKAQEVIFKSLTCGRRESKVRADGNHRWIARSACEQDG